MKEKNSLVGNKYGRLTVLERVPQEQFNNRKVHYKCLCECGNTTITRKDSLLNGHTQSCGCKVDEYLKNGGAMKKHGLYKERVYTLWHKVKDRCINPNCKEYHNYGGRGITMCDEWLNDPKAFANWCYANGYDKDAPKGQCTLDRIDVSKGYEPSNCRFITNKEQQNNRRNSSYIVFNGEKLTVSQWSERLGISRSIVRYHCFIKGKSIQYLIDKKTTK